MQEQPNGADKALVLRLDLRRGRRLRWIDHEISERIPRGYRLASVQVKGFLVRDDERGRL